MKQLLSYIYPVTKTIDSKYSGTLEITWYNGKKHLNSENANYSYGSLQRILKYGLDKIKLSKVNSILILGMGGGSVIKTLRTDFNYNNTIEAVELDPIIIDIAKSEFGIIEDQHLKIHCADAFHFVKVNTTPFDLIIVDLYIDLSVPDKFLSTEFWDNVLNSKSSKGSLLFNASVKESDMVKVENLVDYLKTKVYKVDIYKKVNNTNTIIITSSL
ncbi:Spermidine synthase-like protein [Winogradskyella psychrotolerans RS-3]|uniref:Spermidine synthase-like protein n=1 Tax=Winogradskyella psychrotolerans RS-3 TaxID=641526 RepID=S7VSB2_9FLAO|nr:fused MFS/spermidine synthase [Winogradskyella psychrotolerans]EPR72227.1 Spermidine synthase-like protein [Winogradskyella psychrotolerans RS-3]